MSLILIGGNNYLVNSAANVPLDGSTSIISYGCWAKHSTTLNSYFMSMGKALSPDGGLAMRLAVADDDIDTRVFNTSGTSVGLVTVSNNGIGTDNGNHHYMSVYNQLLQTLAFYRDGVPVGTVDTTITTFPANPLERLVLGRRSDLSATTDLEDGELAEAFVYAGDAAAITDALANLQTKQARFVLDDGNLLHYDALYDQANGPDSMGGTLAEGGVASTYSTASHPVTPTDVSWTLVVVPDTQKMSESTGADALFSAVDAEFSWIRDNQAALAIKHVIHVGDITEDNVAAEWAIMKTQISKLDGKVPYTLCVGNHDYFPTTTTPLYNSYFLKGDNSKNSAMTEIVPGSMFEGVYHSFTAPDGRELMIFGVQWLPSAAERSAWLALALANPTKTIIIAVHAGVAEHPTLLDANGDPVLDRPNNTEQDLLDELTGQADNIQIMLCGHAFDKADVDEFTGGMATIHGVTTGVENNIVHEILHNAQQLDNGGDGWLRYYEFLTDGVTVRCKTYSPYLDIFSTSSRNEFTFTLDQTGTKSGLDGEVALRCLLRLDETTGTTATDESGNANHGTLGGLPSDDSQWTNGIFNGSVHRDSASADRITITDSAEMTGTTYTVAGWVRISAFPATGLHTLFSKASGVTRQCTIYIRDTTPGQIEFTTRHSTGGIASRLSDTDLQLNRWYHIAMTCDGITAKAYIDGVQQGADLTVTGKIELLASDWLISSGSQIGTDVDDFRYYDRELTPTEIGTISFYDGPVHHWDLQETSGTTATDSVGGNDGTLDGSVSFDEVGPGGSLTGAADFVGNSISPITLDSDVLLETDKDWSIALWVSIEAAGSHGNIAGRTDTNDGHIWLFNDSESLQFRDDAGQGATITGVSSSLLDFRHHAFVHNGATGITEYLVDNISQGTITHANDFTINVIGNGLTTNIASLNGQLADFRIYARQLSSADRELVRRLFSGRSQNISRPIDSGITAEHSGSGVVGLIVGT